MTEKYDSDYWQKEFGVTVLDPDGWDRRNFAESWSEKITRDEFRKRLFASTIVPSGWLVKEMTNGSE